MSKSTNEFECDECGRIFSTQRGLGIHRSRSHDIFSRDYNSMNRKRARQPSTLATAAAALGGGAATHGSALDDGTGDYDGHDDDAENEDGEDDGNSDDGKSDDESHSSENSKLLNGWGSDSGEDASAYESDSSSAPASDSESAPSDGAGAGSPIAEGALPKPVSTGMFSYPKTEASGGVNTRLEPLSFTLIAFTSWMFMHCSVSAANELLELMRDERWNFQELPKSADTCIRRVKKRKQQEQPSLACKTVKLDLSTCIMPRKQWLSATVETRGVLPCLISMLTNYRVFDWNHIMHYDPARLPYPDGVVNEPFYANACQIACADAMRRGVAMGWDPKFVQPFPIMFSADDMSPDNVGNTTLSPVAIWSARLKLAYRRSVCAGEHVCLLPDFPIGKTKTPELTRDQRRAVQIAIQVFADEMNELFKTGFVIHSTHIKNCPLNALLLFMPFVIGSSFDAVGAWIFLNSKHNHCYICSCDYYASKERPTEATRLAPRSTKDISRLRITANDLTLQKTKLRNAARELEALHVNPEPTAMDSMSSVQQDHRLSIIPDPFHCVELGTGKIFVHGMKKACEDKASASGTGHSTAAATAILDDFVQWSGLFNNGYHRLPRVKSLTSIRVYTGPMIRALVFSLLALFVSVGDLFEEEKQTAIVKVLTHLVILIRKANQQKWNSDVAVSLDDLYEIMETNWDASVGRYKNCGWLRVKHHLPLHWRDLYEDYGSPVHWSTMHFIEALQRILKAAWKRTNGVQPSKQLMQRIDLGRYIIGILLPSIGLAHDPIAALSMDRPTGAYLLGFPGSIEGGNTLHSAPKEDLNPTEKAWNRSLLRAMTSYITEWAPECLPKGHVMSWRRITPRGRLFCSRQHLCAVRVPALPAELTDDGGAERAIFSMFEADAVVPAGVAGPAPKRRQRESTKDRFIVDFFMSYDIRGLSADTPNAPAPADALSTAQVNDIKFAIDFAVGRRLEVMPMVAAGSAAASALRDCAGAILQRVKPKGEKHVIVEVGQLCQPLWAFPWLNSFAEAKDFFKHKVNKWDADQWLVCSYLY